MKCEWEQLAATLTLMSSATEPRSEFRCKAHRTRIVICDGKTPDLDAVCLQSQQRRASAFRKGPGDFLCKKIERLTGRKPKQGCRCRSRIAKMNAWGPAGCREHLEEIVGWLESEAKKRGWWKPAVAMPGSRYFIRRMVLGAIEKAEAAA